MLLECPNCETVFRINPDDLPVSGRKVQCSVCRHVWQAEGGVAPQAQTAAMPPVDREDARAHRRAPNRAMGRLIILFLILLMLGAITGIFRQHISAGFPQTLPLFEKAGLVIIPDTAPLLIRDLAGDRQRDTIRLTGEVFNAGHLPVHAPVFLLTVTSSIGAILEQKEFTLDAQNIKGMKAVNFTVQVQLNEDVPEAETTNISVVPLPKLP